MQAPQQKNRHPFQLPVGHPRQLLCPIVVQRYALADLICPKGCKPAMRWALLVQPTEGGPAAGWSGLGVTSTRSVRSVDLGQQIDGMGVNVLDLVADGRCH